MKTKHTIHIMVFSEVTSNDDVMFSFTFSTSPQIQHGGLYQVPGGDSAALD